MIADKILTNGKVFSIGAGGERIKGSAVAIKGEKIIAVGDRMEDFTGEDTKVIDCKGHSILPGLGDGHCHPAWVIDIIAACQLFDILPGEKETSSELIKKYCSRLKEYIGEHPEYEIIRGRGWNYEFFPSIESFPTRHDLDAVCSDRPVVMTAFDGHIMWVNTKAIEMAGISEKTPDPETGVIVREEDGFPSGLFREIGAISLIENGIINYDFTVEQYKEAIKVYQSRFANNYGVTMVQDCMCTENAKKAYRELAETGELTIRVRGVHNIESENKAECLRTMLSEKGMYDVGDLYRINTAKFFLEGNGFNALPPFEVPDEEVPVCFKGSLFWTVDEAAECMAKAMDTGYSVHMHAIGDGSVKLGIDAVEKARGIASKNTGRDVIAHLMMVPDEYIEKMGRLKMICANQPRWAIADESFYGSVPVIGEERAMKYYPDKRLREAGCIVGYGTDFPVTMPPNPWHGLECAITRTAPKGLYENDMYSGRALGPGFDASVEGVTLEEGIQSLTYNNAYEMFMEDITGTIEAGKSADLIVLDCDIEQLAHDAIHDIKVEQTIFKGRAVYEG